MKKISLFAMTVAVMAAGVSQSHAMDNNVENPTYMPEYGKWYSKTTAEFGGTGVVGSEADFSISEEIGYGISDNLSFRAYTGYTWGDDDYAQTGFGEDYGMADVGLGVTYRAVASNMFTLDLKGDYVIDALDDVSSATPGSLGDVDDDRLVAAIEAGFHLKDWTFAGEVGYNWQIGDDDLEDEASSEYYLAEAQWRFAPKWSANVSYLYEDNDFDKNVGGLDFDTSEWTAQANYHINDDMVAGVFYSFDTAADSNGYQEDVLGVKFSAQW